MPGTFFTSVGAFSNEDIDNILEPRQPQFPATPATGLVDNGTDISELYAPVSVGSPAALTGYLVNGVDIANIFAVAGSVSVSYTATPAAGTVDEGASLTINVAGTNTPAGDLYWTINHITTANADFSAVQGGPFAFNGTAGSFSITTVADSTTEGNETFTVQVRTGGVGGPVVATTSTITLVDTSQGSYTLGGPSAMDEGVTVNFPFSGTGILQQIYYWRIEHGTTDAGDFSGATSNSFSYTGSPVNIPITTVADAASENEETFTLAVYEDAGYTQLAVNKVITINDTSSLNVSFSVEPATVDEGSTANYTVTGTGDAQTLYWTIDYNSSTDAGDFVFPNPGGVRPHGTFAFNGTTGTFGVQIVADATTEGNQTFRVQIRSGDEDGPILDTSVLCTIQDTSQTPATYALTPTTATQTTEGTQSSYTFTVTNGPASTTYYWRVVNGTTTAADWQGGTTPSGNFVINANGSQPFSATSIIDLTLAGVNEAINETFHVEVHDNAGFTNLLSRSPTAGSHTIAPAPVPLVTTSLSPSATTLTPGTPYTINVARNYGTSAYESTNIYWQIVDVGSSGATAPGTLDQTPGGFAFNGTSGSFVITPDVIPGDPERTFRISIRADSVNGPEIGTTGTLTVAAQPSVFGWTGPIQAVTELGLAGYNTATPTVELLFIVRSNGTWEWQTNISDWPSGPSSRSVSGNWLTPSEIGIGTDYEIQFVSQVQTIGDPGDVLSFTPAPSGTWYDLTTSRNFSDIIPLNTSYAQMELTFTIREKVNTANTRTRTFLLDYELTP